MNRKIIPAVGAVLLAGALLAWLPAGGAPGDVESDIHKRLAGRGERLTPQAATCFGSKDIEEFLAAGSLSDGTIVAFGNAWGPAFPESPQPTVLGKGKWYDVEPYLGGWETDERGDPIPPSPRNPNRSGMIVFYSADLQKVSHVVKFDWSVATISAGAVAPDDDLLISGSCSEAMGTVDAAVVHEVPNPQKGNRTRYGAVYYENVKLSGDAYVARLSPDGRKVRWLWIFRGHRDGAEQIHLDKNGRLTFDLRGIRRISADGKNLTSVEINEYAHHEQFLAAGPNGEFYRGGYDWQYTGRPREGWRKPCLWGYDAKGDWAWQVYDWSAELVGLRENRLLARSWITAGCVTSRGDLVFAGQTTGARSVFTRSPTDLYVEQKDTAGDLKMPESGAEATWLVRMDPAALSVRAQTLWAGRGGKGASRRDEVDGVSVSEIVELADGSLAIRGQARPGLIHTANAFVAPVKARQVGGEYVTVLGKSFRAIRCSSVGPDAELADLSPCSKGLLVAGRAGANVPTHRPAAQHAGGRYDAYLIWMQED